MRPRVSVVLKRVVSFAECVVVVFNAIGVGLFLFYIRVWSNVDGITNGMVVTVLVPGVR